MEPTYVEWDHLGKHYRQVTHEYKLSILNDYCDRYPFKTFVETGHYMGTTMDAMHNRFEKCYSIELNNTYYERAFARFSGTNVTILQGDSELVLPRILPRCEPPVLFWLDAHGDDWIGPVVKEVEAIYQWNRDGVILVDDMDYITDILPRHPYWDYEIIDGIARSCRVLE